MGPNRDLPFLAAILCGIFLVPGGCAGAADPPRDPLPQFGESPIEDVIAAMTTEEKAKLLVGMGFPMPIFGIPPMDPEDAKIPERVPGAAGRTHAVPRLGIPSLTLADGPAGLRIAPVRDAESDDEEGEAENGRTYHATAFPIATLLASSWDPDLVREVGEAIGTEVLEYGVDVLLAPGMNLHRNPLGGRNFEYYSEDPLVTGHMAAAYVDGVESRGVGTSIKHFAANNQEFNRMQLETRVSERALREIYLRGFEIAVERSQPWTVMSAYNKINGVYASESRDLLTTLLRDEWGFEGFVMTDWFAGRDPVAQMRAGNDVIMPGNPQQTKAIIEAVEAGELSREQLDANVERVLRIVERSQTFRGYRYSDQPPLEEAAAVARRAAAEGMVLLENDGALPLAPGRRIALFGNVGYDLILGGTGSGDVNEAYSISLDEGLEAAGHALDAPLRDGYEHYLAEEKAKRPEPAMPFLPRPPIAERPVAKEAVERAAREADVAILAIGRDSGEFTDRPLDDFTLSAIERELIETITTAFHAVDKKVVVVLNVAGVVETASWRDQVDAILLAWQPGQEGGHAIADVLGGAVNPSGKLTMTFPKAYADVPSAESFPGEELPGAGASAMSFLFGVPSEVTYDEGIWVGYRYYDAFRVEPAYPFGYGLSYTEFDYQDLEIAVDEEAGAVEVRVTVTNAGEVAGRDVAQVYVAAPGGTLVKPASELRAFVKTDLLAPGRSQELAFSLEVAGLASFDSSRSAWVVEAGRYAVRVGASSRDIRQVASFELAKEHVESTSRALVPSTPIDEIEPPSAGTSASDAPRARTEAGIVEGEIESSGVRVFRGIPYAAPPVGDLRWRPPSPPEPWDGVRSAASFGPRCVQAPVFPDMVFRGGDPNEDCLYLNVWTPDLSPVESLPVLVYFYGGGFVAGDGSEPRYDGESMARRGIVTVTLNYRLGVFGFLAHPELTAESPHGASGNYGLLDQARALAWVQENIAAFGGDPARVTIAGESAGSLSVSAHLASPLSRDQLAGAIGESGSIFGTLPPIPLAEAEERGTRFAEYVGVESIEALRALPAERVLTAASKPGPPFSLVVDGHFFPKSPIEIYAAGEQAKVPLLLGWNSEEMPYLFFLGSPEPTPDQYAAKVREIYGDAAGEVLALYPGRTTEEVRRSATDLASDRFIGFSTWKWFELHRQTSDSSVYRYFYAHPRPPAKSGQSAGYPGLPQPTGAPHAAEIEYALGNLDKNDVFAWTEDDHAVSEVFQSYLANFVATGDPNGPGLPKWPAARRGAEEASMVLRLAVETRAEPEVHRQRYLLLDRYFGD